MLPSHWIIGEYSTVEIESTPENFMGKIFITCGKNCQIKILGITFMNKSLSIHSGDHAEISIGSNQLMNGNISISAHEKSKITIGENCLWANTKIWSSDFHKIIDLESNERINHAQDITIGKHVWFGEESLILKGSVIHDGCIIGARSVITKSTAGNPNSIIAGNPARIVRSGIAWQL
jgi:acetyltransferase-like isoleucine patch superfamily enzyme